MTDSTKGRQCGPMPSQEGHAALKTRQWITRTIATLLRLGCDDPEACAGECLEKTVTVIKAVP